MVNANCVVFYVAIIFIIFVIC